MLGFRLQTKDSNNNGINVKFHKEGLCFKAGGYDPMSELMLSILGAVAQFELSMIQERCQEGIEEAKAAGKYRGRPSNQSTSESSYYALRACLYVR